VGWLAALCRPQERGRQCAVMFSFLHCHCHCHFSFQNKHLLTLAYSLLCLHSKQILYMDFLNLGWYFANQCIGLSKFIIQAYIQVNKDILPFSHHFRDQYLDFK